MAKTERGQDWSGNDVIGLIDICVVTRELARESRD